MFLDAVKKKSYEKILELMDKKVINLKKRYRLGGDEMPALLLLIKNCYRKDIIQKIITAGADINAVGYVHTRTYKTQVTPLYMAVNYGPNKELLYLLIQAGADLEKFSGRVTEREEEGGSMVYNKCSSCLHYALESQNYDPEVIDILLENGASYEIRNDKNLTPLQTAAFYDRHPSIISLVRFGCSGSSESTSIYSPLVVILDTVEISYRSFTARKMDQLTRCICVLLHGGYDVIRDKEIRDICKRVRNEDDTDGNIKNICKVVEEWICKPKSLKVVSRLKIRSTMGRKCNPKTVRKLPLPDLMKKYLNLEDLV